MTVLELVSNNLLEQNIINQPLHEIGIVSGGNINDCYFVENRTQKFFVKVNNAKKFPEMFQKEAKGLNLLRASNSFIIPKIIAQFDSLNTSFLVLEWIEKGSPSKDFWMNFAEQLSSLHQQSNNLFGLEYDNFIGSLIQKNNRQKDWHQFYFENRILPQLQLGIDSGWTSSSIFKYAERMNKIIEDEFPKETPVLLHGDLWNGNFLVGKNGHPFLIDPAIYYGNREMELSFMLLFGGFDNSFYSHYQNFNPIRPDFNNRLKVHQLYPLLVHANLFGESYIQQSLDILRKF